MAQTPSLSDHQRRLTAARDAVVEAAEDLDRWDDLSGKMDTQEFRFEFRQSWKRFKAAVANLRAVKKEMENG